MFPITDLALTEIGDQHSRTFNLSRIEFNDSVEKIIIK